MPPVPVTQPTVCAWHRILEPWQQDTMGGQNNGQQTKIIAAKCTSRESNSGLVRGKDLCYHYTTSAGHHAVTPKNAIYEVLSIILGTFGVAYCSASLE